jgi:hypothetical protein
MATRSIVTSQPDVACDICERRLLRGEHPEVFVAGSERRTVCELCTPRAAHEGWLREVDGKIPSHRAPRGRRGRTLLDRLRALREPAATSRSGRVAEERSGADEHPEPYEFLSPPSLGASRPASFLAESFDEDEHQLRHDTHGADDQRPDDRPIVRSADPSHQLAIETFNASEGPRRIAGVARSLGAPEVTVRHAEGTEHRVWIVVAWELSWYRYEADLQATPASVTVIEQGTELEELPLEDRAPNATADERGELAALAG